jgi:hypothetical protein
VRDDVQGCGGSHRCPLASVIVTVLVKVSSSSGNLAGGLVLMATTYLASFNSATNVGCGTGEGHAWVHV